ncbi:MAG: urease accessory protein UreF [Pseudanabaenaceae cyanobacterium bins.68]|nr:urease accessory protein UreF [Pseudanabaenaceae cyanobacterium bins.68]
MDRLLRILQLASPSLPVGAYSYSEGIEWLGDQGIITDVASLRLWLDRELSNGAIRIDGAVLSRIYRSFLLEDFTQVNYWNRWLSAQRETAELRHQSWQMGLSLYTLLCQVSSDRLLRELSFNSQCNFVTAFGITAACWQIPLAELLPVYLFGWLTNLVSAGVRTIPLGQTQAQQLIWQFQDQINTAASEILNMKDEDMECCSVGLALASMQHETQYSRLFRS